MHICPTVGPPLLFILKGPHLPFSWGGRKRPPWLPALLASVAALAAPMRACFAPPGGGICRPCAAAGWPRFGGAGLRGPGPARKLQDILICTTLRRQTDAPPDHKAAFSS